MIKDEVLDSRLVKVLKPSQVAIIVVDVMDAYCDPSEPLPRYLAKSVGAKFSDLDLVADRIVSFLDESRKYGIASTVFVRMVERPETLPISLSLKMEIDSVPPVAQINGQGWNYYKVSPKEGDYEIVKYSYDSFFNTNLNDHLLSKNVETVVIVGGHASVCVDTTARTAAQLGYHTFVPADLTADPSTQNDPKSIRNRLDTINKVMGYMPLSKAITQAWESLGQK